ncbi:MAG TPA: AAA family ATPase [Terriglobia bacterium]|nr:AAA family ATPase [Terriglobia bacterium]
MATKEGAKTPFGDGSPSGERLSLVTVCLEHDAQAELRQFVVETPFLRLQAEANGYIVDEDTVLSWMQPPGPDICLIDFDRDRAKAITTAERIHERLPRTAIFAISANSQPALIIEAMRCGCSEYVVKPVDREQLLEAIARVGGRKREKREEFSGQLLTVLGAKGGSGATTIATHLAAFLAKSCGRKTLLIDLHSTCGEAALFLGQTKHQYHFYELVENVDRLDAELLQSFVLHHPSGLDLLPAPDFSEAERHVRTEHIGQAIDFIRSKYEFIVLDCTPGLTEQNLEVIRRSDYVYLITTPEVPALRNVARLLDYFNRREFSHHKVNVVVNRHHVKNSLISDGEIEKVIRKKIFWKVPNQYKEVIRTIHSGDPSAQLGDSAVARSIQTWAKTLGSKPEAPVDKKKSSKSFLSLFGG